MPRQLHQPPFPDSPGLWLACFRYRGLATDERLSPEELGKLLGVSGTTVRRWESGAVRPTRRDIARFAAICGLAPIEIEFLYRAFSARQREAPPPPVAFEALVATATQANLPCFIMDSLFYMRVCSSYFSRLMGLETTVNLDRNVLDILFAGAPAEDDPRETDRLDRWVRGFWLSTARLAGSPPYCELLRMLRAYPAFERRWLDMALTRREDVMPVNLPYVFRHPDCGSFRIIVSTVAAPPDYQLREYIPADETAQDFIEALRREGPPIISSASTQHWASPQQADED